ncbi:MAG: hypothetical protein ACK2UH_01570, partial [Candidatus Promineifilaceae bacterium]
TYTVTVTAANAVSELATTTTVTVTEGSRHVYLPLIISPQLHEAGLHAAVRQGVAKERRSTEPAPPGGR